MSTEYLTNWLLIAILGSVIAGIVIISAFLTVLVNQVGGAVDVLEEWSEDDEEDEEKPHLLAPSFTMNLPEISPALQAIGWHYCPDWDLLLVKPGTDEWDTCTCSVPGKQIKEKLTTDVRQKTPLDI